MLPTKKLYFHNFLEPTEQRSTNIYATRAMQNRLLPSIKIFSPIYGIRIFHNYQTYLAK